jgi:hypothetical protein
LLHFLRKWQSALSPVLHVGSETAVLEADQLLAISQANSGWYRKILTRISDYSLGTAFVYALARFYSVRVLVKTYRRLTRRGRSSYDVQVNDSVIGGPPLEEVLGNVHSSSWSVGPSLGTRTVRGLLDFMNGCEYVCRALPGEVNFHLRDRIEVEFRYQKSIALADAAKPMDSEIVRAIASDRTLHEIARRYFGYPAMKVDARLLVSFATDTSPTARLTQKQTIFHHYDLDDFHMLIFNFYLTHVNEDTGAHVLLAGTHGAKSARQLFCSLNFSDAEISRR